MSPGWVLVVDDDPDIREAVSTVLSSYGYDVVGAGEGGQALAHLDTRGTPALVLLDLRMPGMSSAELIQALRRERGRSNLPVVVLSGDGTARRAAAAMGATEFLNKPVELENLLVTVERYAGKSFLGGEPSDPV